MGFWPLHVGRYVFMLGVFGIPHFDQDGFRQLVWLLQERYGDAVTLAPSVASTGEADQKGAEG